MKIKNKNIRSKVFFIAFFLLTTLQSSLASDIQENTINTVKLFIDSQMRTLQGIITGREQIMGSCLNPAGNAEPSTQINTLMKNLNEEKSRFFERNSQNAKKLETLKRQSLDLESKNCNIFQALVDNENSSTLCGQAKSKSNLISKLSDSHTEWSNTRTSIFDEFTKLALLETKNCVSNGFTTSLKSKYDNFNTKSGNKDEGFFSEVINKLSVIFSSQDR